MHISSIRSQQGDWPGTENRENYQKEGQERSINVGNMSIDVVAKFKYMETTLTDQN
jgi:hypothetical protein